MTMDNKELANNVPNPIKDYIKDNLRLKIVWNDCDYFICLCLDDEIISKIKMEGI